MELTLNLDKSVKYVASVSGGVDSMVLLDWLRVNSFSIIVVHFNHNRRQTSINDEALVNEYCLKYQIPIKVFQLTDYDGNFQASARQQRIDALVTVAKEYNIDYVLTGHHLDDHLETIIMNNTKNKSKFAKAGLKKTTKLSGITFLKPLLTYTKAQLLEYANTSQVPFVNDETNLDPTYLRNFVRLQLKNDLRLYHSKDEWLAIAKNCFSEAQKLRNESIKLYQGQIEYSVFANQTYEQQLDIIAMLFDQNHTPPKLAYLIEIIRQILLNKPNLSFKINHNINLVKEYTTIKVVTENIKKYHLVIENDPSCRQSNLNWVCLCYNNLDTPLVLRSRKSGDYLMFPFGKKKLKSYLIDQKVPRHLRDGLLLVVDAKDQILWIPNAPYLNQTLGDQHQMYLRIVENEKK